MRNLPMKSVPFYVCQVTKSMPVITGGVEGTIITFIQKLLTMHGDMTWPQSNIIQL